MFQTNSIFVKILTEMGFWNLRKNYFYKLIKYIKNVYKIDKKINRLTDARVNPTFKTDQVILPVLFGFLLRIKSFIN